MTQKLTKLVATIGPATETEEIIGKLIDAGMNVARFNTKHSSPEWHQERIARVRQVARQKGAAVGIMLDLQGPEIRINLPGETPFDLVEGETAIFTARENLEAVKKVLIPQNVIDALQVGNVVLLDDGACEFEVTQKNSDHLVLKALSACTVKHRKTMNVPGVTIDMPSLIEADYAQLDGASGNCEIDFVALSFVRSAADIEFLREELVKRKMCAGIIAKIETQAALDHLEEIVDASDAVMVARGDLGVEMPYEELTFWQKRIIDLCRASSKPVITATQMLKSMTDAPRPTRAEVSDVAHAIYDGTDAIMLSEETTIGKYPVRAVATQAKIAAFNEPYANDVLQIALTDDPQEAITNAAVELVESSGLEIAGLINMTISGRSAHLLSSLHPSKPIIAVTASERVYFALSLSYGVQPVLATKEQAGDLSQALVLLKDKGLVTKGQRIVATHGVPHATRGTNTISIVEVS
ncbi:pyruvate kinase [bacterium]|nr:pyruvate kinase [bacterium]